MEDVAKSTRIETLLASGGGAGGSASLASADRTGTASSGTVAQAEVAVTYKIGDVGPAGGMIFYDKGNNTGGWRYLEAAPAETEITAIWVSDARAFMGINKPFDLEDSVKKIGTGKTNTQDIDAYAKANGGGFGWAAVECADLSVNGFDDWFLPSLDELNFMYGNLHRKEEGGFRNENYWSSTSQENGAHIRFINFANGTTMSIFGTLGGTYEKFRVRACRQF
jgi:hypothetical protein